MKGFKDTGLTALAWNSQTSYFDLGRLLGPSKHFDIIFEKLK